MKELALAYKLGIPVFDVLEDLLDWANGRACPKEGSTHILDDYPNLKAAWKGPCGASD
jgi:hypothetical protein